MPQPLKDPRLRRRQNRTSTAAKLQAERLEAIPDLPPRRPDTRRKWHAWTLESWRLIRESPMASEFLAADVPGLIRLAMLWDDFVRAPKKVTLAAEIRQQEQRFGLSPLDRRRLQWTVERVESAARKERRPVSTDDPRATLQVGVVQ